MNVNLSFCGFLHINKFLIVIIFLFYFQNKMFGQYLPTDWQDYASAGRGNATTAWVSGGTALFSNPAGLSILHNRRSKNLVIDTRSPIPDSAEANGQILTQLQGNPKDWIKNALDSAYAYPGQPSFIAFEAYPYFLLGTKNSPVFLIGFPARSENSTLFLDTRNLNNATVKSINTISVALAISDATKQGGFRWGISVRPNVRQTYYSTTYNYADPNNLSTQTYIDTVFKYGTRTTAVAADAGIMATFSDFWFPTFGASIRNIPTGCSINYIDPITYKKETMCGALRTGDITKTTLNEDYVDPTEVRVGISITPRGHIGRTVVNLRLSADLFPLPIQNGDKYYGIPSIDPANLLHAGGELFFGSALVKNNFALRGGYMNQAASWGASVNLASLTLAYASYQSTSSVLDSTNTIHNYIERRHLLYLGWQL